MIKIDGGIAEPLRFPSMGTNEGFHYAIEKPHLTFRWGFQLQEIKLVGTFLEDPGLEIT